LGEGVKMNHHEMLMIKQSFASPGKMVGFVRAGFIRLFFI
jgi:hypothetical protein